MGRPATWMQRLRGGEGVWGRSRVPLPAVGIMTFIRIPFLDNLTAFLFKAEPQPQESQIRKCRCYSPLFLCRNIK